MGDISIMMQINSFQDKFKIHTLIAIKRMSKTSHSRESRAGKTVQ